MTLPLFGALHYAAAQAPFTLASSPNIGSFVRSVTVADVNNDGTTKRATNSSPAGNRFFRLSSP
jgi:hypothetical protein